MQLERIDDPSDPRVADYRDLPDPELRRRRGLFVVEGRDIAAMLLDSARFSARSVFLTEAALADLADRLAERADVRVFVASAAIVRSIVGYRFHRGCLALGERGPDSAPAALIDRPGPRLLVAAEHVTNPDNVGGIFRNGFAFGVDAVLLSGRSADPLYRKSIRVSIGGSLAVPFARLDDWPAGLERMRACGYIVIALTPHRAAMDIAHLDIDARRLARVALLVGAEDHGLSAESRASADFQIRIAMAPGVDSLNVATATGIALHRLTSRAAR